MMTALGLGALTVAWRFVTFDGFSNDHYGHLAMAQQMILGDRPLRDFYDPGWPLMYLLSAGAWRIAGGAMGIEWLLTAAAFAVAAACTAVVAYRLSSSLRIALAVTLLEVLIYPRSYAYPKLLVYATGAWAIVAVAVRPSAGRVWILAAIVAASFLLRHDHGLFLGLASVLVIVDANRANGRAAIRQRVGLLIAAVVLYLAPWMIFVQMNGGLVAYFTGGLEFAQSEARASALREWPRLFTFHPEDPRGAVGYLTALNADGWLFWVFWGLPFLCGAVAYRSRRMRVERWPGELSAVAALIVLAVLVNAGFLRDVLQTRLADAVVPAALLGSWLLGVCWSKRPRHTAARVALQIASIAVLSMSAHAVGRIGRVPDRMLSAGMSKGIEGVLERSVFVAGLLRGPHRQAVFPPSRFSQALLPFFAYLDRCTWPDDRLLVTGEFPDVLVLGGRGFAGDGVVFGAWYTSLAHEDHSIAHVSAQSVPFALLMGDHTDFRLLHEHLDRHYELMAEIAVRGNDVVRVLVDRQRPVTRTDPETGWRCFR